MTSEGDSIPTKKSDSSLSASPSTGLEKARPSHHSGEETHNNSTKAQKRFLSHREAEAGGPADIAACGEEDPGAALEMLVENPSKKNSQ